MAPRTELVSSAVTFLRDPSVASSPLEKRLEFLKSKNLTQEEIDLALSQASGAPPQSPSANQSYYPPPQQYQQPPPGYYPPPYGSQQWPPPPPQEPPKRDWRDLFILATTITGASYTLYLLANRYIKPLIAPPTPPQLQQDKESIDEQFTRAFALLDTLTEDTATLKSAEEARTKRLDTAIADIEVILSDLKAAKQRQEDDARRMEAEMKNIRDSLPRSIENVKDASERQLKDLSTELSSLKSLMLNRMPSQSTQSYGSPMPARIPQNTYHPTNRTNSSTGAVPTTQTQTQTQPQSQTQSESIPAPTPGAASNPTGVNNASTIPAFAAPTPSGSSSGPSNAAAPKPSTMNLGYGAGKVSIPAWQLAAQNKKDEAASAPVSDGADAVAALQAS